MKDKININFKAFRFVQKDKMDIFLIVSTF